MRKRSVKHIDIFPLFECKCAAVYSFRHQLRFATTPAQESGMRIGYIIRTILVGQEKFEPSWSTNICQIRLFDIRLDFFANLASHDRSCICGLLLYTSATTFRPPLTDDNSVMLA